MVAQSPDAGVDRIERLRSWLLAVLVIGLLGTVTELVLLEHYEQPLQFVPLVLIVAALAAVVWHFVQPGVASRRALLIIMALFVLAGFAGIAAHFFGSAEYQLELDPEMDRWELLEKILRAKAPPVLAPGMMLQLGLLGLAYVYSDRHRRADALQALGPKSDKE
jgi:hypothetical protein